jgi:hypothetical protein
VRQRHALPTLGHYFVAAGLDSPGFGNGFRGNISFRVAASYTTDAITAEHCIKSPAMA